ncbi:MAG: tRNA uridine-5-carboxymethylaminomethyl(34) synthesis enzyme MnmG [Deltaproteobacteria bacterium]|nr:tRNA uridine-5-carboxymethylaminomethyl(34) synthesis enzyme MnmG [Deltaproteobacteria bacterium]
MISNPDLIVIGAGHAGCEAAHAAARSGRRTLLLTLREDRIGWMSCNPAIGGMAKGHLVREIDALGGLMGLATDRAGIQFRTLNTRRGPAVRGTRAQVDRRRYALEVQRLLAATPGLEVREGLVEALLLEPTGAGRRVTGVVLESGETIRARAVVVTTGTFLGGVAHVGQRREACGREGEPAAEGLSRSLREAGLELRRFKTGTTPRLDGRTIDPEGLELQHGDEPPRPFSLRTRPEAFPTLPQRPCRITETNATTHEIINNNKSLSPIFDGTIEGTGPRYCPSVEDKVHRFPDRAEHTVFLEPDGLDTDEVYPAGLSTSLPVEVQLAFLRSIRGLSRVEILRPGYAIEYDCLDPRQLQASLQARGIAGLFFAGQVNGTSGYEEAAGQGLLAGVNAARWLAGEAPVILRRDEAYLGVLIDDLATVGTREPYRMFTSRAEHRLRLREDNAGVRLLPRARELGLLDEDHLQTLERRAERTQAELRYLEETLAPAPEDGGPRQPLAVLLRRPETRYEDLRALLPGRDWLRGEEALSVEVEIKYAGYARRLDRRLAELSRMEGLEIPEGFSFEGLAGLSREVVEKLSAHRPRTLGQASRISGVTPAALDVVAVHLAGACG